MTARRTALALGLVASVAAIGGGVLWTTSGGPSDTPSTPTTRTAGLGQPAAALAFAHRTRTPLHVPPPAPAPAALPFEGSEPAPRDRAGQLPPMVVVPVTGRATVKRSSLARAVLTSDRLAVSPRIRSSIRAGDVPARSLQALLRLGDAQAPLLVFRADRKRLRVQATSLRGTGRIVAALQADSTGFWLRPVSPDFADEGGASKSGLGLDVGTRVAAAALQWLGVPYSWGGGNASGPSTGTCTGYRGSIQPCPATRTVGFDCSGLTLYAYAQVGITLDHYAAFQWHEGRRLRPDELAAGDLLFFHPKGDGPGHVGIYIGEGRMVHAPRTGDVVKVSVITDASYASSFMGAVRPY